MPTRPLSASLSLSLQLRRRRLVFIMMRCLCQPVAPSHSLLRRVSSLTQCVLFFATAANFQCCARNCWQSSPQGKQQPNARSGHWNTGKGGSREAVGTRWGGVVGARLSFKAARAAVSWLHKNEITQDIKLAQISAKNLAIKTGDGDIVVTLKRTNSSRAKK